MPEHPDPFIAGLVEDLAPVRPLSQRRGMALALGALLAGVAGAVGLNGPRADIVAGRPEPILLLSAGLFAVLALASAWAAIDIARPFVGSRREGWVWTALMAAVLPASALVRWAGQSGAAPDPRGWECMAWGLGWSLFTAAVLVAWLRRGAPTHPARAGLLAGVAAGSAGIFAVSLYCPSNELLHIGLWHGMSVVVAGLIGRLVIPRLVAW